MRKLSVGLLALTVFVVLLGIGFVVVQVRPLQASPQSKQPASADDKNNLITSDASELSIIVNPVSITADNNAPTSTPEVDVSIVQEAQMLIQRWEDSLLLTPGWYHVISQHDRANKEVGSLPNGQSIPLDYVMDGWYKVNSDELVEAGVFIMRDFEGNEVQKSIYQDGTMRNLTFGIEHPAEPAPLYLDFGFNRRLAETATNAHQLTVTQATLRNKTMSVFTIRNEDALGAVAGFDQPITGSVYSAYFDSAEGSLARIERAFVIDGEVQVIETVDLLLAEMVTELPIEIQEALQSEVKP